MSVRNKVAIITGSARGIGRVFAETLAEKGAKIVIQDINGAKETAENIVAKGFDAIGVEGDISKQADVQLMVSSALEAYGRIDILINNAGIFSSLLPSGITDISVEDWDSVMAVNVRGPFLATQAVIPSMRKQGGGCIINIASTTALAGLPFFTHYVASKGAVISMTRALARELGADNILVNAIAPGYTLSDGTLANQQQLDDLREGANARRTIKRDQTPDDLVGAVLYFVSTESNFVTGQTLCIDGGTYMS